MSAIAHVVKMVAEFEESIKKHPLIAMGTPDPYVPPKFKAAHRSEGNQTLASVTLRTSGCRMQATA